MIAHLRGTAHKMIPGEAMIDVQGVGYLVRMPLDAWETLTEGSTHALWISTYIREDRMDLFGFLDNAGRRLFEELIAKPGIGPKLGLELCAVPRSLLLQAIAEEDPGMLQTIKGIGKKTAEKLLLELKSLVESNPEMFGPAATAAGGQYDRDAVAALSTLGYDNASIMQVLKDLPLDLKTTEERVTAALRSL